MFFDITWAFLGGSVVLVNFFVSFFAVCRLPLANREYIKTAGLRSTVAWAMASLAEISVSECSLQGNGVLNEGEGRCCSLGLELDAVKDCGDVNAPFSSSCGQGLPCL